MSRSFHYFPPARADRSEQGSPQKAYHAPGAIPKYLQKFKREKEEARILKEIEDKRVKIPEGFRLVPEDERVETLAWFSRQLEEVDEGMSKLPIRIEINSQKNRERKLMEQKKRLEEGIKMFSGPMVRRELIGHGDDARRTNETVVMAISGVRLVFPRV